MERVQMREELENYRMPRLALVHCVHVQVGEEHE